MTAIEALASASAVYLDASALPKIDIEEDPSSPLVRCLIYMSRVPAYCSLVGFGEFITVAGKKLTQSRIGAEGYLYSCRALLVDFGMGKLHQIEPVADRFQFIQVARGLLSRHAGLGGGDLWHIMAALELRKALSPVAFLSFDKGLVKAAMAEGLVAVYGHDVDTDSLIQRTDVTRQVDPRMKAEPPNKGMKQTSVEHTGRSRTLR